MTFKLLYRYSGAETCFAPKAPAGAGHAGMQNTSQITIVVAGHFENTKPKNANRAMFYSVIGWP